MPTVSIAGSRVAADVLIRGQRAPIVGAVSMDMLTADVTDIDEVNPGDEVVFLGSQGDGAAADARRARDGGGNFVTIPYEVLCRLGARVHRIVPVSRAGTARRSQRHGDTE